MAPQFTRLSIEAVENSGKQYVERLALSLNVADIEELTGETAELIELDGLGEFGVLPYYSEEIGNFHFMGPTDLSFGVSVWTEIDATLENISGVLRQILEGSKFMVLNQETGEAWESQ